MDLLINIDLKKLDPPIRYEEKIMLMGSCFTEHIGNALTELKFSILQNPNGVLFGPDSVCRSLGSYVNDRRYSESDLIYYNELYSSWQHHSRFSSSDKSSALNAINGSMSRAHDFLRSADWLIITLGSAFSYRLNNTAMLANEAQGAGVANCHRAPASWFTKQLLSAPDIASMIRNTINELNSFNPKLKFLFTISPVRHIRDGVVDNNRSKARLITAIHEVIEDSPVAFYFPAYELVIDVLRDYRFYDIDLVHPNYAATEFVLEKFSETCIDNKAAALMQEIKKLVTARKHRAFQPDTRAHQFFLTIHLEKTEQLKKDYPFLDLSKELAHFSRMNQDPSHHS